MAKNFIGKELNVGDKVVYLDHRYASSSKLEKGIIYAIEIDKFKRTFVDLGSHRCIADKTVIKIDW